MNEMIEREFGGFFFEALAKHPVESEVGGVGRVTKGVVVLRFKLSHRLTRHGEREEGAVESLVAVKRPGMHHALGIFVREIR